MITPAGPIPDIRLHTSAEISHCALEEGLVHSVINELDCAAFRPMLRAGICDNSILRILGMLTDELEAERPSGRLYVDSLAHALATNYVLLDVGPRGRPESRVASLGPRILESALDLKICPAAEKDLGGSASSHEVSWPQRVTCRA